MPIRDIIFVVVFFSCLPFCFFRPFFGICMWTVMSFLNPHSYVWSMGLTFPWAELVAILTIAGCVLLERNWRNLFCREVFLIFVLWSWFTFTTFYNAQVPEFVDSAPDTWYRYVFVSKVLCMVVLTIGVVNTWDRLRKLILTIAGSFGFLVAKAVPFIALTGGAYRVYGPKGTMIADNNDVGLVLNMTLPIFFFLAKTEQSPAVKKLMVFLFVGTIPTILFTYSRGAMIGLVVLLLSMIVMLRQRLILIPLLFLAVCLGLIFAPQGWQNRMDFRNESALIDSSAMSRFNAWTYCWNLAQSHPLTGGGFDAFTQPLFDRYAPNPKDVHGPHSIYFGVLAEHGFPGLALYLTLGLSTMFSLFRLGRRARYLGDEETRLYSLMLRFSMLGFLIVGAFLGRAYFDYYFTVIACAVILKKVSSFEDVDILDADVSTEAVIA